MSFSTGGSGGAKADINVTPLVDVVLVLLIIFMVITPMLEQGVAVQLPRLENAQSKDDESDDIILTVAKDGRMYYDQDELDAAGLQARLGPIFAQEPNKPVLIKGDVNGRYADVRRAMELTQKAGAKQVGLMADKESREIAQGDDKKGAK